MSQITELWHTDTGCKAHAVPDYDVEWLSPSEMATDSMPIGNGDLAANVWVEGQLRKVISTTDTLSL